MPEFLLEIGVRGAAGELAAGADRARSASASSRPPQRERAGCRDDAVETFSTPRRLTAARPSWSRAPDRSRGDGRGARRSVGAQRGRRADAGRAGLRAQERRRASRARAGPRRRRASTSRLRKHAARARRAVDVLPDVLGGALRGLTFPEADALGRDARGRQGRLLFGRPIRWILFLYGGRVVPFTISRTPARAEPRRCRTSSARRRHLRPPVPDDERPRRPRDQGALVRRVPRAAARELRHPRARERHDRRIQEGRSARPAAASAARARRPSALLAGVPRSRRVSVGRRRHVRARVPRAAGRSADDDADSPSALLSRSTSEDGKLKTRSWPSSTPSRQRAHDRAQRRARRHGAAARRAVLLGSDRKRTLESRIERLATLLFHKKLGTLPREGERIERAGRRLDRARGVRRSTSGRARRGRQAARLAKADLDHRHGARVHRAAGRRWAASTRARRARARKRSGRRSTSTTCRSASRPTRRRRRRSSAATRPSPGRPCRWPTSSTRSSGCFAAGEKPTGSRDPYGLRRAGAGRGARSWSTSGRGRRRGRGPALERARRAGRGRIRRHAQAPDGRRGARPAGLPARAPAATCSSSAASRATRCEAVLARRRRRAGRSARRRRARLRALPECARVARGLRARWRWRSSASRTSRRTQPAAGGRASRRCSRSRPNATLHDGGRAGWPGTEPRVTRAATDDARLRAAGRACARPVDRFFADVLVMAEDPALREARLRLMATARSASIARSRSSERIATE